MSDIIAEQLSATFSLSSYMEVPFDGWETEQTWYPLPRLLIFGKMGPREVRAG